jgi:hypothetical protein
MGALTGAGGLLLVEGLSSGRRELYPKRTPYVDESYLFPALKR